jgi:hypothetical protein
MSRIGISSKDIIFMLKVRSVFQQISLRSPDVG